MKKFLLLSLLSSCCLISKAQLTTSTETNDTTFIYSLAGAGVTVTNLVRNCAGTASGFFNSTSANVGIDEGILLTSGDILNAPGPNNSGSAGLVNGAAGDTDLDALIPGYLTYDGCSIEFDMQVMSDTVRINYVFGSEEYQEWVGSSFNDVFAFWVSGPGIPDPVNIATVPGTDIPVAINNVNAGSYPAYYIDNGDGVLAPYSSDPYYVQYDGLTTALSGNIATIPGETYHMKIAVADAGDGIYDTGVFIKTGSLGSLRMGTSYYGDGTAGGAGEKCSNGYIEFVNYVPGSEDLIIDFHISGTAVNGSDYETITEQIIIPAGMSSAILPIIPIDDEEIEGSETIVLDLYNPQSGYIYSTLNFTVNDEALADYAFEVSDATVLFTNMTEDAISYAWDFGDGTSSAEENPSHIYLLSGDHTACLTTTNAAGCTANSCKQVSTATALDAMDNEEMVVVYPNPASDHFTIALTDALQDSKATITDMLGRTVFEEILTGKTMDINTTLFPKGIYSVTIRTEKTSIVKIIEIR